jgi:ubiquinone/menaquinone biosynthesis C-methylase UbiE
VDVKQYYDTRAPEYDEWYLGLGRFAARERPGWSDDLEGLTEAIGCLPPARTLDIACGTGYLTRHLRGEITALDQSEQMLAITRERVPDATVLCSDALTLPFPDRSFARVFTGHFYGHLEQTQRQAFLAEARRLAPELVIVDSAVRPDHEREEWQERVLNDGSRFQIYKRFFDADELVSELGGGTALYRGRWFVMVSSRP